MPRVGFQAIGSSTGSVFVEAPESCADPSATLDLAALSEGGLSTHGIQRLARHVVRCPACQIVLAAVVQDALPVDATRKRAYQAERLFKAVAAAEQEDIQSCGYDG